MQIIKPKKRTPGDTYCNVFSNISGFFSKWRSNALIGRKALIITNPATCAQTAAPDEVKKEPYQGIENLAVAKDIKDKTNKSEASVEKKAIRHKIVPRTARRRVVINPYKKLKVEKTKLSPQNVHGAHIGSPQFAYLPITKSF